MKAERIIAALIPVSPAAEENSMKVSGMLCALSAILMLSGCGNIAGETELSAEKQEETSMVITAKEAKEIIDGSENYVILDVREADEFAKGHIEGAIQISYTELEDRAEAELPDKDQTILVYCRSGRRSAIAAQSLVKLGYTDVRDFGGILDWPYETVRQE